MVHQHIRAQPETCQVIDARAQKSNGCWRTTRVLKQCI